MSVRLSILDHWNRPIGPVSLIYGVGIARHLSEASAWPQIHFQWVLLCDAQVLYNHIDSWRGRSTWDRVCANNRTNKNPETAKSFNFWTTCRSFFVFVSRKKLVQKYAIKMACVDTMFIPNESPPFPERAAAWSPVPLAAHIPVSAGIASSWMWDV